MAGVCEGESDFPSVETFSLFAGCFKKAFFVTMTTS